MPTLTRDSGEYGGIRMTITFDPESVDAVTQRLYKLAKRYRSKHKVRGLMKSGAEYIRTQLKGEIDDPNPQTKNFKATYPAILKRSGNLHRSIWRFSWKRSWAQHVGAKRGGGTTKSGRQRADGFYLGWLDQGTRRGKRYRANPQGIHVRARYVMDKVVKRHSGQALVLMRKAIEDDLGYLAK